MIGHTVDSYRIRSYLIHHDKPPNPCLIISIPRDGSHHTHPHTLSNILDPASLGPKDLRELVWFQ